MNKLPQTLAKIEYLTSKDYVLAEVDMMTDEIKADDERERTIVRHKLMANTICDRLIETVGRFTTKHGSDFLLTLDSVINNIIDHNEGIYCFGIRNQGVDGNLYTFERFKENRGNSVFEYHYYRAIYAIEFHKYTDELGFENVRIQLKDVTGSIHYNTDDDNFDEHTINQYNERS